MLKQDELYLLTTRAGTFQVQYVGTKWCKYRGELFLVFRNRQGDENELEVEYVQMLEELKTAV